MLCSTTPSPRPAHARQNCRHDRRSLHPVRRPPPPSTRTRMPQIPPPASTSAGDAAGGDTIFFVGTTAGACGPIRHLPPSPAHLLPDGGRAFVAAINGHRYPSLFSVLDARRSAPPRHPSPAPLPSSSSPSPRSRQAEASAPPSVRSTVTTSWRFLFSSFLGLVA